MSRPPDIRRPTRLELSLPEDIRGWLDLKLFSPIEQRVPKGAYRALIIELIEERQKEEILDLAIGGICPPGAYLVRGTRAAIEQLKALLSKD